MRLFKEVYPGSLPTLNTIHLSLPTFFISCVASYQNKKLHEVSQTDCSRVSKIFSGWQPRQVFLKHRKTPTPSPGNRFRLVHILMWIDGQVPTELGQTERVILNHWMAFIPSTGNWSHFRNYLCFLLKREDRQSPKTILPKVKYTTVTTLRSTNLQQCFDLFTEFRTNSGPFDSDKDSCYMKLLSN